MLPAAAAAGAGEVLDVELDVELDEADVLLEDVLLEEAPFVEEPLEDADSEPPLEPSFLVELYRSEYQPPPLSTKLERLTILDSVPAAPHALHVSGVGSLTFWSTSMVFPQL